MKIPASLLAHHIHAQAECVNVRQASGSPFRELTIEELSRLIDAGLVCGVGSGRGEKFRLRYIALTVSPDVAGRALGESGVRSTGRYRSSASVTTMRALASLPRHIVAHHKIHCLNWSGFRYPVKEAEGAIVFGDAGLTGKEVLGAIPGRAPLVPPMRPAIAREGQR